MRSTTHSHWRLLAELLRPDARRLAGLGAALAGAAALPLVGPQLLRAFIDRAAAGVPLAILLGIAGTYVVLGVGAQATTVATTYAANKVAWRATNTLRERAFAHALSLDLGFHRDTTPGALIERVDGDATAIAKFFTDVAVKAAVGGLMLVGVLVASTIEDWRAGAALAGFAVVAALVIGRLRNHAVPATAANRAAIAGVFGVVEERLAGAEDLRALGAADHSVTRLEAAGRHALATGLRAERRNARVWAATSGLFALGALGMLLGAAWLHATGAITIGTVFLLFSYTQVLRQPVEQLTEQLQEVQRAAAGASRIADLLAVRSALPEAGDARLPEGALPLSFEGVAFAYDDEPGEPDGLGGLTGPPPVVTGVDVAIPAGCRVGLVGRTGSGKTTLARLALRLVDPTEGVVRVGGHDLRDVAAGSLRARTAIVTQDVQLYRASVRDNLTLFGALEADDGRLAEVLADIGLGGWLASLPEGLDTSLGPTGAGLSAGEAQLVGLARVFLRTPGVVVLDEASSRVDPATQRRIEAATDRLLAGRTALVIAHRLSSVLACDRVLVLEAGRVVEDGAPGDLAADPASRFARLLALDAVEVTP